MIIIAIFWIVILGFSSLVFWMLGYFSSYKEGDVVYKPNSKEDWEKADDTVFQILKVGKYKYQVVYLFPLDMRGWKCNWKKHLIDCLYTKYTGSLENIDWDKLK